MASRIEDYALIGDCQTAALVGLDGSIDWLCLPRFDSGACFAALLGTRDHGRWQIAPAGPVKRVSRKYRPGTLVLETTFETADGAVMVTDFMPLRTGQPDLVRLVTGVRGTVRMRTEYVVRPDYGSVIPWVRRDGNEIMATAGPDTIHLRTPVELRGENWATIGAFDVTAGKAVPFVLTWHPSHVAPPPPIDPVAACEETTVWWQEWSGRCRCEGNPYAEAVTRSLITLKALTYAPTGGIVAAPTTSLPEHIGGKRNWDYRYCWLRDSTFTLTALIRYGYADEAKAWREWLLRAVAGKASHLHIMYGVAGERRLPEYELPWLPGYERSRPVRIGNAAYEQFQLDVFGEVLGALHVARNHGLHDDWQDWRIERELLTRLEELWHLPDEGIWEIRGPKQHFVHSKLMAWLAFDRAVKDVERFGLDGPADRWRKLRDDLHAEICAKGFNPQQNSFVQHYGSEHIDASVLVMPEIGFLPAMDPRFVGTVAAVEKHLLRGGAFVNRYQSETHVDGLPPGEGAFLLCSYWLAGAYVMMDRRADAERVFEALLAVRNDVGLLAEEYDPDARRQLGNFPQAFSHIGLVNTARLLTEPARAMKDQQE
jgi:GH15 family glucan-1,4-alpha-glucosidase